jgi:uncharacterized protein
MNVATKAGNRFRPITYSVSRWKSVLSGPRRGSIATAAAMLAKRTSASHTVCAVMTAEFLAFSKSRGNDLSTPMPEFGFLGLKPGDRWCLCAPRWQEEFEANNAPRIVLRATHEAALSYCKLADLKRLTVDLA